MSSLFAYFRIKNPSSCPKQGAESEPYKNTDHANLPSSNQFFFIAFQNYFSVLFLFLFSQISQLCLRNQRKGSKTHSCLFTEVANFNKPTSELLFSEASKRSSTAKMAVCTVYTTTTFNSTCSVSTPTKTHLGFHQRQVFFYSTSRRSNRRGSSNTSEITCAAEKTVVIGLAADSGCGKSTFMRRLTSVFGGAAEPPRGGNPDSNTLISDTTTVICLDDYHSLDRTGRKVKGVTALDPRANDFDLMYEQVKALKEGTAVDKPIYNHVSGLLDPPELIKPPKILVIEGLHPMYDSRVRDLLDFSIYLDISNEVKFAWKIQRDMEERGHSLESIKASIEARKPDFDAYIDPQKQYADAVIEVLPTQLIPGDNEGKVLRVRLIMKEGVKFFSPVYLFDEGSTISWIPCGRKLTCSYPGIKFFYGPDAYFGNEVSVLEMDGQFDRLDELIYVESHLSNISTRFYGEVTQQMLKHSDFPGSNNGTGLFQTIVGLKIRDLYEQIVASRAATPLQAAKA
ncbi:phosphoribulokinase, chloroplastic-like [Macadamia integrifolia]|uniref:phosphoribulokinase, chloroplastic-like n=1 Tax=Macadamia integrifolia TaxID=60698 RepID=UPI001C4EDD90|nr:phosphoribulokinase, chloroplastic-like [Macadamia integrifolia]